MHVVKISQVLLAGALIVSRSVADINVLDRLPTKGPELLNAYVEPNAMAAFESTGRWADGTQIVNEFSALKTGAGCDPGTVYCKGGFGERVFETGCVGWA
ncbi:hypothetical protein [Bradyrhizobium cenepequi]|uniref:hypothetical protein n=1 Tax=Bradyrhizobium cenepequi TaxID=2821403 RepID=UPI001CE23D41|nr:hypothetical protein [Bradyrhizobium cenepequi]MCA6108301.1 hypothetical protein [Bradyrhizobium cenepequi]